MTRQTLSLDSTHLPNTLNSLPRRPPVQRGGLRSLVFYEYDWLGSVHDYCNFTYFSNVDICAGWGHNPRHDSDDLL